MPFKEGFVSIKEKGGDRKLAYTSWGDENNPKVLVCVHGLSRNGRDFDFLAKQLEGEYRIICPDVVGRGNSDWLKDKKRYSYATYVSDVLNMLDQLEVDRVDWVGTSMGGIIGMLIASQKPDLINKMVLNDIGYFISGKALDRIFDYVKIRPEFASQERAAANIKMRMSTFGVEDEKHWQHIFDHSIEKSGDVYTFRYDPDIVQKLPLATRFFGNLKKPSRIGKCPDVNLRKIWDSIESPVFVIKGELSDIFSEQTYKDMLSSKEDAQGVVIKGVGHAPMLMDEEQISFLHKWLV